ncbi:hypothetical protein NBRC116583_07390 [Arenicella sp. 4NH20-0111]
MSEGDLSLSKTTQSMPRIFKKQANAHPEGPAPIIATLLIMEQFRY